MTTGLVALMYHGVGEPADPAEGARYTVSAAELDAQLECLVRAGLPVADPHRVLGGAAVALTFDDGEASVLRLGLPRLCRLGLRAFLFMTTGWLGRPGYLDGSGLRELQAAGWLIGSHGHTHRFLNVLSADQLDEELRRSRDTLGTLLGHAPGHLSLPGGRTSVQVEAAARRMGFTHLWSSWPGINAAHARATLLRRTAVRRGLALARFRRLVQGDRWEHLADETRMAVRGAARRLVGEERYHALTAAALSWLGRR